jgi:carboxyl-terminal processing protease
MRRGLIVSVFLASCISLAALTTSSDLLGQMRLSSTTDHPLFHSNLKLVSVSSVKAGSTETRLRKGDVIEDALESLDANSEYLPHKEAAEFEIETEQRYAGIGVEVEWSDNRVTIVSSFEGSPGELAGLLPGDQIVKVDGKSTAGEFFPEGETVVYTQKTQRTISIIPRSRS